MTRGPDAVRRRPRARRSRTADGQGGARHRRCARGRLFRQGGPARQRAQHRRPLAPPSHAEDCRSTTRSPPSRVRRSALSPRRWRASTRRAPRRSPRISPRPRRRAAGEGDPLFYGSFMHLFVRLRERFAVRSCRASPAWRLLGRGGSADDLGRRCLTVLPARCRSPSSPTARAADAAVIMKVGRNLAKARAALTDGRPRRARGLCRARHDGRRGVLPLADKTDGAAPYFSMVLVPGQGRRP